MNVQKYPYKPFPEPVPPIPIIGSGNMCITFDKKYLPYILGALKVLEAPQTYESDQESAILEARQLISKFIIHDQNDCNETCIEYPLSSSLIGFAPKNPFTQAGEIPDGYIAPPFYVLVDDAVTTTLGLQAGDVISGWFSLPVLTPALGQGLARFRVTVNGPCTVELHLLTIPSGGVAWVVDDDNPLTLTAVDLNRDLVSLPPETGVTVIQERTFTTEGEHHIDVSFLAQFNDAAVFLGYGGGIRKVVVCGGDELMLDVRQNPFSPCVLEKRNGAGEWQLFANLLACVNPYSVPKIWRVSGGHTQVSTDNGTTFYDFPDGQEPEYGQTPPTYTTGVDKACVAAYNLKAVLQKDITDFINAIAAGGVVLTLVTIFIASLALVGSGGIAAPVVFTFIYELYLLGATGLNNAFTAAVYDEFICEVYTHIGSDGVFTGDEFAALILELQAKSNHTFTLIATWLTFRGLIGTNNSLNLGAITTCPATPCDHVFTVNSNVAGNGLDTAIDLVAGDFIHVAATGTIKISNNSPFNVNMTPIGVNVGLAANGYTSRLPSATDGALIMRIGTTGAWVYVGTSLDYTVPAGKSGRLYFAINDDPAWLGDNSGSFNVTVTL